MPMYSMKYLDKELRKYGYVAYPPTRLGRARFIRLYGAGNMHIHVCYEETALGPVIESIDIIDFDEDDLGKPLQRYVATSSKNEVFRYSGMSLELEDFIQIILGPPSGIVMRLENEVNRKALETLE